MSEGGRGGGGLVGFKDRLTPVPKSLNSKNNTLKPGLALGLSFLLTVELVLRSCSHDFKGMRVLCTAKKLSGRIARFA